jgi:hypothetical protein
MRGIETYRFLPAAEGGVLGRGKFSTVYKVTDTEGKDVRRPNARVGNEEDDADGSTH